MSDVSELIADAKANAELNAEHRYLGIRQLLLDLADALSSATARAEAAEGDAERYRWLKEQRPQPMWAAIPLAIRAKYGGNPLDENAIDAALDAALAAPRADGRDA